MGEELFERDIPFGADVSKLNIKKKKKLGQQAESFYPKYYQLWNEDDPVLAEDMIYEIIDMYDWDLLNIPVVSPELLSERYV